MKLELTKRWIIRKQNVEEKELEEGIRVEYYGTRNRKIENPMEGEIKKDEEGFYICWDDIDSNTQLDDSKETATVLKNCGWI